MTPSGVQATTDTITVTFQSDYDLSAVAFDDIDVAVDNDGTPGDCSGSFGDVKNLAAAAGATDWGASVAGQVLTLTPQLTAAVGEVPANSCIRILIGQNATGGASNDQIINPSTAVSHAITLGGGFGDTGTAYTFNNDSDQVTVTATVAGGGGGGGGGPTCPPTCPTPVIFNIRVNNITETEADVLWDTDIASTSFVDYGTTVAYGSTASTGGTTFNHSVHLSGLTPGTLYHFRVRSTASGAEAVSGDNTFTTLDTTAPVISNVQAVDITGTSARIIWDTNEDANSRVDYDTVSGPPYAFSQSNATLTNAHSVTLTGLAPNTVYRYRVTSTDASGNSTTSVEFTFTTADTVPPAISSIFVDAITENSARVNWSTDELADSTVRYGLTDAYGSTVHEGALVANHQITLTGLAAGTLYHFSVSSTDAAGNGATSTDQTFTTLPDTTPPSNVSGFTVTPGDQQNALSWTNPNDPDFAGVRIQRSTSGYPGSPTSGTTIYDSNGTSVIDVGLTNGVTYYYTAFAYDGSGNFASGALGDGTPFDTTPPGPVSNFSVTAGDAQNSLTWTNPGDADFADVRIQRSTTGFPPTPTSGTNVYIGSGQSFNDTGLTNGTTYYYSVFTRDTSGNYSAPAQGSGTPSAVPPPAPVCGDNACQAPEDSTSCPADCPAGPPPAPVCGDNACQAPEDNASCPADCPPGPPPPAGPVCGNAICEAPEDNASCPADCPAGPTEPPVEPPPQTSTESIDPETIQYYALSRRLRLHRDERGFFRILPSRSLSVLVPEAAPPRPVTKMVLNFGSGSYLFQRPTADSPFWSVDVSAPSELGLVSGTIIITYDDETNDVVPFEINVEGYGRVMSEDGGVKTPVEGAVVTLYRRINPWIVWDATAYLQQNPVTTPADGSFAYMAPQGEYYISVSKDGYRTNDSPSFDLTTEVVNPEIELIKLPPSFVDVIVPGAPIIENIGNVAKALGAQGAYITKVFQNEFVENPSVKTAATGYLVPAAAAITTAVVATAVQATSLIGYLYFLLTQPLLLLGRRKRKEFGVVFNSLTKLPVDLAIVRLFRSNGKLVRTSATDKQGRYAFLVDPGEYRIEATKQGYVFPSQYLKDKKEDGQYLDLYHGETIRAGEKGAIITANIPMDPLDVVKSTKRLYWEEIGRKVQGVLAFSGVILTLVAALLYRLPYLWVLTGVQIVLFFLFRRLAKPKRPKNWGIIYDEKTKKPIPFAVARIVETQYNKVLESRVTDARGRYNFLVGNNKYVVTVEKPGYEPLKTKEIDLSKRKAGEAVVDVDIPMKEKGPE
ncbi:MAG TPA: fibronectin type III domain-containing protein [Candidatus Eisenbacteria bacterium]|nr:fibronectin type III domain-containing protein [Candidatus Eisenbacteria bacterium]